VQGELLGVPEHFAAMRARRQLQELGRVSVLVQQQLPFGGEPFHPALIARSCRRNAAAALALAQFPLDQDFEGMIGGDDGGGSASDIRSCQPFQTLGVTLHLVVQHFHGELGESQAAVFARQVLVVDLQGDGHTV